MNAATIRNRMRRTEARALRIGLSKLAEDFACVRRCAPVLYLDMSPDALEQMASDNRATAKGGDAWPDLPPSTPRERRRYATIAYLRDGTARALADLLRLHGIMVVRWLDIDTIAQDGCSACGANDLHTYEHAYVTGAAGCTLLCTDCMRHAVAGIANVRRALPAGETCADAEALAFLTARGRGPVLHACDPDDEAPTSNYCTRCSQNIGECDVCPWCGSTTALEDVS